MKENNKNEEWYLDSRDSSALCIASGYSNKNMNTQPDLQKAFG